MTLPTPDQLARDFDSIEDSVRRLRELYALAYPNAYARPKHGGGSGSRTQSHLCPKCKGDCGAYDGKKWVPCADCDGEGSFGVSDDSVGNEIVATERFRKMLDDAVAKVRAASVGLGAATDLAGNALRQLEPKSTFEPADVRLREHPSTEMETLRAKAAQVRRNQRAEESGDYSEVSG